VESIECANTTSTGSIEDTHRLISFATEYDLLVVLHAALHHDLQNLFVLHNLVALALRAPVLIADDLPCSVNEGCQ